MAASDVYKISRAHNDTILQPHIIRRFESSARVRSCSLEALSLSTSAKERLPFWDKNEMLFTLGHILIKPGYPRSTEKLALSSERDVNGQCGLTTSILTAARLHNETHEGAGFHYAPAVNGCLNFDFGDSQEAKSKVGFVHHVIGPLEEAYQILLMSRHSADDQRAEYLPLVWECSYWSRLGLHFKLFTGCLN
ncbi:hypothetical protein EPUS_00383 [Endocarpon pusillum Z07020]|uniref:Uncharacterized protein n=1 Tax=Endocarpon pusillum (strain Z07020 / HMAS-L-300199) TaxID=1263415 RepID=U1HJ26_ENDPU|nr:uncharacterized protein EPUS_00383 [Endocarpon pusillum Z07020]ERF70195.1 hypothetical protein EPUS_00383 [Endocarpon pusillum Z07020]